MLQAKGKDEKFLLRIQNFLIINCFPLCLSYDFLKIFLVIKPLWAQGQYKLKWPLNCPKIIKKIIQECCPSDTFQRIVHFPRNNWIFGDICFPYITEGGDFQDFCLCFTSKKNILEVDIKQKYERNPFLGKCLYHAEYGK